MKIIINGVQCMYGGGNVLLHNFLFYLSTAQGIDTYFAFVPQVEQFDKYQSTRLYIHTIPQFLRKNFFYPFVNRILIPHMCKKFSIDLIFNFSDIPVPVSLPQIFLFDWPYAAYPNSPVWKTMDFKSFIIRRSKLYFFKKYFKYIDHIICQSDEMHRCLKVHYEQKPISVIPSSHSFTDLETETPLNTELKLPEGSYKLLFPALYYPHKNFEILLPLAQLIKKQGVDIKIVLTLDESQHPRAKRFIHRVFSMNLNTVIFNCGQLINSEMPYIFKQCDAVIMPTLMESFGLPYIEAMEFKKLILTSDLGFARAVCKDAALYFDPYDPKSILDRIEEALGNTELVQEKIENGTKILQTLPSTREVQEQYLSIIDSYRN